MTPNLNNEFQSWNLSQDELASGYRFSDEQLAVLHNEIATIAHNKINLKFDPSDPIKFAQIEADLAGQINILRYLIIRHTETTQRLQQTIIDNSNS